MSEKSEKLQTFVEETARELSALPASYNAGGPWYGVLTHEWYAELRRADGLVLNVSARGYDAADNKAEVYPDGVKDHTGQKNYYDLPKIGLSIARLPLSAARDIAKRLLPQAEAWHQKNVETNARYLARHQANTAAAHALAEATNGVVPTPTLEHRHSAQNIYEVNSPWGDGDTPRFTAKVNYGGNIEIKIDNLDLDTASAILTLVSDAIAGDRVRS